jgi:hypothetical protein
MKQWGACCMLAIWTCAAMQAQTPTACKASTEAGEGCSTRAGTLIQSRSDWRNPPNSGLSHPVRFKKSLILADWTDFPKGVCGEDRTAPATPNTG